eukprot:GFUD01112940.1.p1 GENE.GFUD01112940.1~~GFUD01112940.1.p1  ORF type:complete len:123 (+),score=48.37 GFUD01112940.1:24-371(+)
MWSTKYKMMNMVQTMMFRMPGYAKCTVNVVKVLNVPERSTPQPRMEVARNTAGNILVFSDKNMKKGTIRIERKFSGDWREVTQVYYDIGGWEELGCEEEVSYTEVFRRVEVEEMV